MKIKVKIDGRTYPAKLPYGGANAVFVQGVDCPHCREPLAVQGGQPQRGHDTYTARAWCVACKEVVGEMVVVVDTIFGIEEDERVLNARCRVY